MHSKLNFIHMCNKINNLLKISIILVLEKSSKQKTMLITTINHSMYLIYYFYFEKSHWRRQYLIIFQFTFRDSESKANENKCHPMYERSIVK